MTDLHETQTIHDIVVQLCAASAGGLPLIMAALDQVKFSAKYAFLVLHHLMDRRTLPAEQVQFNAGLVARMQGLRRCSTLLCPLFSEGQQIQLQRGLLLLLRHILMPTPILVKLSVK